MAKVTRFIYHATGGGLGLINIPGAVIVPSSEEIAFPRAALQRAQLTDALRTKTGWTIETGVNDSLDGLRGASFNAVVAAGYYATGAALATAIVTALEAADPTPVWACSYSGVTNKFTISSDLEFELQFFGGSAKASSICICIGFPSTDTGAGFSHVAPSASYQSRHWITVDLGSAQAFTAGIIRGHNLSSAGTATLQADAASLATVGLLNTATPDFSQVLGGTSDPRVSFFASQSKRYLRLILSDVQNPVGYAEIGIWFAGTYAQPSILESINFVEMYEPLSEVVYAAGGAHSQVKRTDRLVYTLEWEEIETANIDIFRALNVAIPMGACFFLSLDAADNPTTSTVYGFLRSGLRIPKVSGPYSNVGPLEFAEALG